MSRWHAAFVLLLLCLKAFAWAPTYGAEFTFTNAELIKASEEAYDPNSRIAIITHANWEARDRMAELVRQACRIKRCRVTRVEDQYGILIYKVTYEDGWWFKIATDPYVVEVQTKPSTLEDLKKSRDRIRDEIFSAAAASGMEPRWSQGGGHIHIGLESTFGDDLLLLRNCIVDYANHAELATGAMDNSKEDATALAQLTAEQRSAFAEVIEAFDRGEIGTAKHLGFEILQKVYGKGKRRWDDLYDLGKNHAMNLTRLADPSLPENQRTVEMRAVRTQLSEGEFLKVVQLFEARLAYLKKINRPIPFLNAQVGTVPVRARAFWQYLEETGLYPNDYFFLLSDSWKPHFHSGKRQMRTQSCGDAVLFPKKGKLRGRNTPTL